MVSCDTAAPLSATLLSSSGHSLGATEARFRNHHTRELPTGTATLHNDRCIRFSNLWALRHASDPFYVGKRRARQNALREVWKARGLPSAVEVLT
jgi:hypothetical protein